MKKILYKLPSNQWIHFCYLPDSYSSSADDNLNTLIDKWAKEEFNLVLATPEDMVVLKHQIRDKYREIYPDLYYDLSKNYDLQGWTRVWLLHHLKEEAHE